jgi:membrane-associated protease RseP (regulator of RpoE activity)
MLRLTLLVAASLLGAGAAAQTPTSTPAVSGWIGFLAGMQPVRAGGPRVVVVLAVAEESPAQRAGLAPGDTLLAVDGVPLTGERLQAIQTGLRAGDLLELSVRRGGAYGTVSVQASPRPIPTAALPDPVSIRIESARRVMLERSDPLPEMGPVPTVFSPRQTASTLMPTAGWPDLAFLNPLDVRGWLDALGWPAPGRQTWTGNVQGSFVLRPMTPYIIGRDRVAGARLMPPDLGSEQYPGKARGLRVIEVAPGTPAADSGLRPGDVLLQVGAVEVDGLAALRRTVTTAAPDQPIVVLVLRDGTHLQLTLPR